MWRGPYTLGGKHMRIGRWLVLTGILLTVSQGCATYNSRPMALQEMQSITSLRVVRYESARLQIKTSASEAVALTGALLYYLAFKLILIIQ